MRRSSTTKAVARLAKRSLASPKVGGSIASRIIVPMTVLSPRAAWTALLWVSCFDAPASLRAVEAAILSLPESA
jgi:hypothetical protein